MEKDVTQHENRYLPVPMETFNCFEVWWPVEGYEGLYEVSNLGRVKSIGYGRDRILTPVIVGGYLRARLCKDGKKTNKMVHRLVMESFVGECYEGYEVDHRNTERSDNRLSNLHYVTRKENNNNPITKRRHSEAARKRAQDIEWLSKQRETIRKLTQTKKWRKNHAEGVEKRSKNQEWLENHARAMKEYKGKPVLQIDLNGNVIKEWTNMHDAERELGIDSSNIYKCCQGKRKSVGGYIWKYKNNNGED